MSEQLGAAEQNVLARAMGRPESGLHHPRCKWVCPDGCCGPYPWSGAGTAVCRRPHHPKGEQAGLVHPQCQPCRRREERTVAQILAGRARGART